MHYFIILYKVILNFITLRYSANTKQIKFKWCQFLSNSKVAMEFDFNLGH